MPQLICRECKAEDDLLYNGVCVCCAEDTARIYESNDYYLISDRHCPADIFDTLEGTTNKAIFHRAKAYNTRQEAQAALQVAIRKLSK